MPAFADRVLETATTTGTGDFTTAGARTGYETCNTAFGLSTSFYYAIVGVDASDVPTGEWEVGIASLSGTTTLVRETVLQSSNADALVNFGAGTKLVFCTIPATVQMTRQTFDIMLNPMTQI